MRPITTLLGCAAGAALVTLTLGWPRATFADPPQSLGEGVLENVTFRGELVRDASVRSGWIARATYDNAGDEEATCDLALEVTRTTVHVDARTIPGGTAVWARPEHVVVPAHGHVMRSEEVPPWLAAQLGHHELATLQAGWVSSQLAPRDPARPDPFAVPGFKPPTRSFTLYQVEFEVRR
jgi:hypothetical protein